jgi:hypothetical protein
MSAYWLSFADARRPKGTQFLGALILPFDSFLVAVTESHRLGLNPGGEVVGAPIPSENIIHPSWFGVLLNRATIDAADADYGWAKAKP